MKKQCPDSFIAVGAASVALRHALFDLAPLFLALDKALAAAHPDMKALGIARMEIAPGELMVHEAAAAPLKMMAAHDTWRAMLERHGIAAPTDAAILACHRAQGVTAVAGSSLAEATTKGNWR